MRTKTIAALAAALIALLALAGTAGAVPGGPDPNNTPPGDPHAGPVLVECTDLQFDPEPGTVIRVRIQIEADDGYRDDVIREGITGTDRIVHVEVGDLFANNVGRYRLALPDIFGDRFTPWHSYDCQDCVYDDDFCPVTPDEPTTTTTTVPPTPPTTIPPAPKPPTTPPSTPTLPGDPTSSPPATELAYTGAGLDWTALGGLGAIAAGLPLIRRRRRP